MGIHNSILAKYRFCSMTDSQPGKSSAARGERRELYNSQKRRGDRRRPKRSDWVLVIGRALSVATTCLCLELSRMSL